MRGKWMEREGHIRKKKEKKKEEKRKRILMRILSFSIHLLRCIRRSSQDLLWRRGEERENSESCTSFSLLGHIVGPKKERVCPNMILKASSWWKSSLRVRSCINYFNMAWGCHDNGHLRRSLQSSHEATTSSRCGPEGLRLRLPTPCKEGFEATMKD